MSVSRLPVLTVAVALLGAAAVGAPAAVGRLSPCDVPYPSDAWIAWRCRALRAGERVEQVFGDRWEDVLRFNRIDRRHAVPGVRLKVPLTLDDARGFTPMPHTYPPAEGDRQLVLIDLGEQFLGAYEFGRLVFSAPAVTGERGKETPSGDFRVTMLDRRHESSLYRVEGTTRPYPMHYALRFHVSRTGVEYWIHGRDLPGYPDSHGCIGLYDEEMQAAVYGVPSEPRLADARRLFDWVAGSEAQTEGPVTLKTGPRVRLVGQAPVVGVGQ